LKLGSLDSASPRLDDQVHDLVRVESGHYISREA